MSSTEPISIHALREEGDGKLSARREELLDFYPRPPRGGRPSRPDTAAGRWKFLSTPSARRATMSGQGSFVPTDDFYPRPPRGGRPTRPGKRANSQTYFYPRPPRGGRQQAAPVVSSADKFLSTPSARRATRQLATGQPLHIFLSTPSARRATFDLRGLSKMVDISIHALREEGDSGFSPCCCCPRYFYPRPPRGGRRPASRSTSLATQFLSTPSARRATGARSRAQGGRLISIHALREEGDPAEMHL